MNETKQTYGNYEKYLLPALCLISGILIGFLLSPIKNGKVTLLSGNTIGSKNGCGNRAGDGLIGAYKYEKEGRKKEI